MNWLDIVKKSAPILAETIVNPAGGAIDALKMIAEEFNTSADPSQIEAKIEADPQAEYKLKYLELKLAQNNNATQIDKAQLSDVEDARDKEIEREKLGILSPEIILVITSVLAMFATLASVFYLIYVGKALEGAVWALVGSIVTSIITEFKTILSFYFGNSKN